MVRRVPFALVTEGDLEFEEYRELEVVAMEMTLRKMAMPMMKERSVRGLSSCRKLKRSLVA